MNYKFCLPIIIILAFILRFYRLGQIPFGFYQDESAIGYNGFSILQTGRDEYGKFLPLYFKSFGDYKLPVYIYSTIIPLKLFGLTEFAVRFPSAFFGFLTIPLFYLLVREISRNNRLALISAFLLTVNPWHLHYNRAAFEVSLSLFFYVLGTWALLRASTTRTSGMFFLGTISFLISLYTYNLTRLLSPVIYLTILIWQWSILKKIRREEKLITCLVALILLLPFVGGFFEPGGINSATGTLIFTSAAIRAPLLEFRSYLISLPTLFNKLFFNSLLLTIWHYLNNLANFFSLSFFFTTGSNHGNHGVGNVGLFHLFELPLITIGIWQVIKQKLKWGLFMLTWMMIVCLVVSLTREVPHATRSFFLLVSFELFSAVGLTVLYKKIKNQHQAKLRLLSLGTLFMLIAYSIIFYLISYYLRFPILYAKAWRSADRDLAIYLKNNDFRYQKVIFDKSAGFVYTSLLFYAKFDPTGFQQSVQREPDDSEGFSQVKSFGKYEFREINREEDYHTPGRLIITQPENKPAQLPILATFTYPQRPVVIADKQKLLNFSFTETAYILLETGTK